jgi:tetratricopeptide (TPR) repeat protein
MGSIMRKPCWASFAAWGFKFTCVMLIVGCCPSFAQRPASAAEIVGELRQGNNQQALSLARQALATHPDDCQLLSLQALAFNGLEQSDAALRSFEKALTKCPEYLPALEGAAQIAYAKSNPTALPLLNRIIALQPDNTVAHAMLASVLRRESKCNEAERHFEASRPLFARQPQLQQDYGYCLVQTGNLDAAQKEYSELLASKPSDNIRYDVALLQWKAHADDDALATLAALVSSRQHEAALALAARIHEEKGETPQAVDLLRSAIVLSPDTVDNYLEFADIAFVHKSFEVGIDMLNAGLKRLPNSAPLYLARGVLEVQISRFDVAIADFEQAHHLDPKLSFAEDAMGLMQSQQHKDAASLAFFRERVKLHPNDPFLLYLLAEQLSQRAEQTEGTNQGDAIAAARRATVLDPHYQPAHDLLAVLYLRANQPGLAIEQAELALAEDPNDQTAIYQEILAKRKMGNTEAVRALTAKLNALRRENERREETADGYRLQDEMSH